jgi:4-hydroxybenzoyl-CoA thioesterase
MSRIFEHEIRVSWGDCDPAKIAYTGRLAWFALDAINAFWEHVTGGDGWYQLELDQNVGAPFVHMSMDFRSPVTPRHRLICKVWPCHIGTTSAKFRVEARQNDKLCFEGYFVCVFITPSTFQKNPPPKTLVDLLLPYVRQDEAAKADSGAV